MRRKTPLEIGERAPTFILPSIQGRMCKLADHYRKNRALLIFLPNIERPSPHRFLSSLEKCQSTYVRLETQALVIVDHVPETEERWTANYPYPLLVDRHHLVGDSYGVRYRRRFIVGYRERTTIFLLDENASVLWFRSQPLDDPSIIGTELCRIVFQQLRPPQQTEFLVDLRDQAR